MFNGKYNAFRIFHGNLNKIVSFYTLHIGTLGEVKVQKIYESLNTDNKPTY